jgi:hypothetical protein
MNRLATTHPGSGPVHRARHGVPWADGQIILRARGIGPEPSRIVRLRRPFALIGRHPGADIRIEDRAAAPRHAVLVLDHRGLFCVDLLTRTGTRFAGREISALWLGAGDVFEVAGRRLEILQLKADGSAIDPTPGDDDLFAPAGPDLAPIALRPLDSEGPPWVIGSPFAFLGRGPACAVRVAGAGAAPIHCALWREPASVRVVDLLGRTTRVNDRPVDGSAPLTDGDVLSIGRARFVVELETPASSNLPARIDPVATLIAPRHAAPLPSISEPPDDLAAPDLAEVMAFLQQFQADAATLIEGQFDQIGALRRELAALRDDLRSDRPPPPEVHPPFQIEVPTRTSPSTSTTAAWLLDRINDLEPESRPAWKELLGKITSAVMSRGASPSPAEAGNELVPTSARPPENDPS